MNEVPRIWWKLVQEEPLFILKTHVERHQYLVPIPVYGVPKPPFIHSTIEFEDSGISWLFPKIANEARLYIRIWNYFKGFFAYAGLWLLVLGIFTIMTKKREVYYVFLISLILCGSLFIIAGIPDARYTLFVLVAGQAIALNIVFNAFARLRTRSVFKRRHFSHE
jgi:hypothetical protein